MYNYFTGKHDWNLQHRQSIKNDRMVFPSFRYDLTNECTHHCVIFSPATVHFISHKEPFLCVSHHYQVHYKHSYIQCLIETTGSFLPTMLNVFNFFFFLVLLCLQTQQMLPKHLKHRFYSMLHHGSSTLTSLVLFKPATFAACHAPLMLHIWSASAVQGR